MSTALLDSHRLTIHGSSGTGTSAPNKRIANMSTEHPANESHGKDKIITIVVNAKSREVAGKEITFEQVVDLANLGPRGENIVFTVTYKRGHGDKPEGSMVEGDVIKVKDGMLFHVTRTDKS